MTKYGFLGLLVSAALMMSIQLPPVLAEDSGGSDTPESQPPAAETPAAPGDSRDTAKEPDDQSEGFDRYGPGCPYDGRELEPQLVGGTFVAPVCPHQHNQLI